MRILKVVTLVLLIFFPGIASADEDVSDRLKAMFKNGISLEGKHEYKKALAIYEEIKTIAPDDRLGGEAVFRSGFIYDEKLNNPPEAVKFYSKYISNFSGRNIRRAKTRLKTISRYKNVDMAVYTDYIRILNFNDRNKRLKQIEMMKGFIAANPNYEFLDDALCWYANKKIGGIRKIRTQEERKSIQSALEYYLRIIRDYPKSNKRIIVLKQAGDCYRLLGELGKARKMYKQVYEEGGEKGRLLVDKFLFLTDLTALRFKILVACAGLIFVSGGVVLKLANIKNINTDSIKTGIFHSLFFIPCAAVPVALTFMLTDATKYNNTGREPYLLLSIMAVTLFIVFINGIIMKAEGDKKLSFLIYTPAIFILHLSLTYSLFYFFNLLPYVERIIL